MLEYSEGGHPTAQDGGHKNTLPETNSKFAPETGRLEDDQASFLFGGQKAQFSREKT